MRSIVPGTSTTIGMAVRTVSGAIPAIAPTLENAALTAPDGSAVDLSLPAGAWNPTTGSFPLLISKDDITEALLYQALRLTWVFTASGSQRTEYVMIEVREDDAPIYGSVSGTHNLASMKPADFGLATTRDLGRLICSWLADATSFIEADRKRSFWPDVPPMIDGIATRIAANTAVVAQQRRKGPLVKLGEFSVKLLEDTVITKAIRDDLEAFPRAQARAIGFGFVGDHHHGRHHHHDWD